MRIIHKFNPGDTFSNRYKLLNMIGAGGFAEVWKAYDTFTEQEIAIKIYARLDEEGRRQLTEEYARVQALSHPNILKAEHFDICDNLPYLTMRYCAGGSLESQIGDLSATDMIWVVRDIMSALIYLHSNNIVHQDIKPANILIDTAGSRPCYLLCDFGISSKTRTSMSRSMKGDMPDAISMTTFYAPPEKFSSRKSDRQPYPEGDLFSFGVTLLELTGTLVGVDKSLGAEMMNNSQIEVNYGVLPSEPLRGMVRKMISFDRQERGDARFFFDWAQNILERMPRSEQMNVKRIDSLNHHQASRLVDVENDRRKSVLYNGNNGLSGHKPPQPPVNKDEDADLILVDDTIPFQSVAAEMPENRSRTSGRKPQKIAVENIDYEPEPLNPGPLLQSHARGNKPRQIKMTAPATEKKSGYLMPVLICAVAAAVAIAGFCIYWFSFRTPVQVEDEYIPDSDIVYVETQVKRLEDRIMTFSRTKFFVQSDYDQMYDNITGEIEMSLRKCDEILAQPGLESYQRKQIQEDRDRLNEMNSTMSSYTYSYGRPQSSY